VRGERGGGRIRWRQRGARHRAPPSGWALAQGQAESRSRARLGGAGAGRPFLPLTPPSLLSFPRAVLDELRDLWEAKLAASGCLDEGPAPAAGAGGRGGALSSAPSPAPVLPDAARALLAAGGGPAAALTAAAAANRLAAAPGLAAAPRTLGGAPPPLAPLPVPLPVPLPIAPPPLPTDGSRAPKRARGPPPQADGPAGGETAARSAPPPAAAPESFADVPSSSDDDAGDADGAFAGDTLLALFDKVTRTKNRWKATLRACVLRAGGRDVLVAAANGEFEF